MAVLALVAVVGVSTTVGASAFYAGSENGTVTIPASQTVDGSAYIAGSTVVVDGSVQGDLFCAGETVTINGTIDGDVICAGATITVNGTVNGDIRIAGSQVTLGGIVQNNALVGGSSVVVNDTFKLGGDFTGGAENMDLNGSYGRDILVAASSFTLRGTVARDVSARTETTTIDQSAKVTGNLWYEASQSTQVPEQSVVGDTQFNPAENRDESSFDIGGVLLGIFGFVFTAVLGVLVMPRFVHTASMLSPRDALLAFLIGLVAVIITPIVAFILALTMIGLYAGFVLMAVWFLALLVSGIFASYYVGSLILRKRANNALLVAAVGSLAISLALLIPFINVLVFIAMLFTGVGMQVAHIKHQFSKDPYTIA